LWLIDQTRLPAELKAIKIQSVKELIEAITALRIRGAPALGAAGAYGIALAAQLSQSDNPFELLQEMDLARQMIERARPTAVNLSWGVERALKAAAGWDTAQEIREALFLRRSKSRKKTSPSTR